MSWDDAEQQFLEAQRNRLRPLTLQHIRRQLRHFREFSQLPVPSQVQEKHLLDYVKALSQKTSLNTAWGYVYRLRSFFRWATRARILIWDPTAELDIPRYSGNPKRVLGLVEVEGLLRLAEPNARNLAILEVFYGTGLRLGELAALDVPDLELSQRYLRLREAKGGNPRLVPLGDHLVTVLRHYLNETRPQWLQDVTETALWLNPKGARLSYAVLNDVVRQLGKKAGLPGVSAHSLRHAFATHMLERGAPLRLVQILLGHRSVLATQVYTHILPQELLRMYRRTHPRARRRKPRGRTL